MATVLGGLAALWFFWDRLSALWESREQEPEDVGSQVEPPQTNSETEQSARHSVVGGLDVLRDRMTAIGVHEHGADNETVGLSGYPSLVEVTLRPGVGAPVPARMSLLPGQSLDFRFRDDVFGLGIYYKQALYPCNFNIYYRSGEQQAVVGKGYFPSTEFFGLASEEPIERLIIQTQADGNVSLTGVFMFSRSRHPRVLRGA